MAMKVELDVKSKSLDAAVVCRRC